MTEQQDKKKILIVDLNNIWNKYLWVRKGNFPDTISAILHLFRSNLACIFLTMWICSGQTTLLYLEHQVTLLSLLRIS